MGGGTLPLRSGHGVQGGVHRGQRRVIRNGVHSRIGGQTALRYQGFHAGERLVHPLDHRRLNAGVLQAHGQIMGARAPCEHHRVRACGQLFEIDVPNPGNVAAVHRLVVHEEGHHLRARIHFHDLQVLVEARGVLRQVQQHLVPANIVMLQASVLGIERINHALQHLGGNTRLLARRIGRDEVVGRIGRGLGRMDGLAAGWPTSFHGHSVGSEFYRATRIDERRPGEIALLAVIVAQLSVLAEAVLHHTTALLAHLGIGHRVLSKTHGLCQAERHAAVTDHIGNGGAKRVVAVIDEHGIRRGRKRPGNALLDAIDFPATIQLVAEQVQQQHVGGAHRRQHARERQLIALDNAPLGAPRLQKRR